MPIESRNPATGEVEKTFDAHDSAHVERVLAAAHAARRPLIEAGFGQRAAWMRAAADIAVAERDDVAALITREMGKPLPQAYAEVDKCATAMRYYADHAEELLAPEWLDDPSEVGATRAGWIHQPLGTVLAVMPWNFPLWQVVRFAAPGLMAGNTGVLKHASNVPQCALWLGDLYRRAGFPDGAFATLLVGGAEVAGIIADPRIDAVTVTGSTGAGKSVAGAAGTVLKKCVLELGGSDPFVVLPSADLDACVATAVKARTQNTGQSCIAAKRFIVHADVHAEFTARFVDAMGELSHGDPTAEGTDLGPLANEQGRDDVVALVEDARAKGAEILCGGVTPEGPGYFYPATVVAGVTPQMDLYGEECFGPVASVYRAEDLEHALRIANDTSFGLGAVAWTDDAEEQRRCVEGLWAGAVTINGMTVSYPQLPFGGVGESGFGRELAGLGIKEFCNAKTVWLKTG